MTDLKCPACGFTQPDDGVPLVMDALSGTVPTWVGDEPKPVNGVSLDEPAPKYRTWTVCPWCGADLRA